MSLRPHHCRRSRGAINWRPGYLLLLSLSLACALRGEAPSPQIPSIFEPQSTPAKSVFHLSMFVLVIWAVIFVVVFFLIAYSALKFRAQRGDEASEPPQVYGSNRVELAWTVISVLIVLVLFTAVGHQFWGEYRYPALGVVTANELHVPVSEPSHPTPTFLTLLSADTDHSFLVARLAGKTDLIPNRRSKAGTAPGSWGKDTKPSDANRPPEADMPLRSRIKGLRAKACPYEFLEIVQRGKDLRSGFCQKKYEKKRLIH